LKCIWGVGRGTGKGGWKGEDGEAGQLYVYVASIITITLK